MRMSRSIAIVIEGKLKVTLDMGAGQACSYVIASLRSAILLPRLLRSLGILPRSL